MTDTNQPGAGKEEVSLLERAASRLAAANAAAKAATSAAARPKDRPDTMDLTRQQQVTDGFRPAEPLRDADDHRPDAKLSRRGEIDLVSLREAGYIVPDSPATVTAEEFRIVKRALLLNAFARGDGAIDNGNLILVCSAQPNEGKTFCAVNLALSIASERDVTVLLVDADFAKPEILSTLGLEGGKGLVDAIADPSIDLSDCLIRTNIENLSVLPAGRQHHLTTELLASERMGAMVDEIASRYRDRIIIFDSPPALASSAASVLALHVGQVLFVVEAESTQEPQLKEGLAMMSGCPNIQLLLNKTKLATAGRRFGSYYGYGS